MKKYDEFVNENKYRDMIVKRDNEKMLNKEQIELFNALEAYFRILIDEWEKAFNEGDKEDIIGTYIRSYIEPGVNNIREVIQEITKDPSKGYKTFNFKIESIPPLDIDEFIDFVEGVKRNVKVKSMIEVDHTDRLLLFNIKIPYKWIDQNVLKSSIGINKYDL
jgi:hypothetical protein